MVIVLYHLEEYLPLVQNTNLHINTKRKGCFESDDEEEEDSFEALIGHATSHVHRMTMLSIQRSKSTVNLAVANDKNRNIDNE